MQVGALEGIPEVVEGSDLPRMILDAIDTAGDQLIDGDILVVTSKIISKAEGRSVRAEDREDAITAETIRVVATRARADGGVTRIVQNRLGIVGAAAGVDASNTEPGTILLLPLRRADPFDNDFTLQGVRSAIAGGPGEDMGSITGIEQPIGWGRACQVFCARPRRSSGGCDSEGAGFGCEVVVVQGGGEVATGVGREQLGEQVS